MPIKISKNKGISLIEVLVSTSIFSIVMIVSIGALIAINDSNKKAQITRTVIDNLNFAMENMARNLRIGENYSCKPSFTPGQTMSTPEANTATDCPSGGTIIALEGYKGSQANTGDQIIYRLNNSQIERSMNSGTEWFPITSPELSIDNLIFYVTGAPSGDGLQPRVVIVISGSATFKNSIKTIFQIETAVSQRKLDS